MKEDKELLRRVSDAWMDLEPFRSRRERCKRFAYGDQWGDPVRLSDGRITSEEEAMSLRGSIPVTNNLIRRLIKGIVGRYRLMSNGGLGELRELGDPTPQEENDARLLEEFLISGAAFMRVEKGRCRNVAAGEIFFRRFAESDGSDCRMIGMLHEMPAGEATRRFSQGNPRRAAEILARTASRSGGSLLPDAAAYGCSRVAEVWELTEDAMIAVHDPLTGEYAMSPCTPDHAAALEDANARRRSRGKRELNHGICCTPRWQETWLGADGCVLSRRLHAPGRSHPFLMRLYPYIDGEVHSLVEDLLCQQKYVNRLVTLLDDVISNSAKGVLLFPADQLPEGFTWKEMRRLWAHPGGIIPYKRTSRTQTPQQVHTHGTFEGAREMLVTQLAILDEVGGLPSVTSRGETNIQRGAEAMRRESENGIIAILDILSAFRSLIARRDRMTGTT